MLEYSLVQVLHGVSAILVSTLSVRLRALPNHSIGLS